MGPPESITQTGSRSVQPFLHSLLQQSVVGHVPLIITPSHGDLYPHLIRGSLGPPDSASQTASRFSIGSAVLHSSRQSVPILHNGPPFPSLKIAHSGSDSGMLTPSNTYMVLWAHPSPQPKRHLDRFSHLHSSRHSVVGDVGECPFPSKLPLPMGDLNPI